MASTDNEALLERVTTEGFEIDFDPPGDGMCFYAATGHQLGMSANAVHKLIFNYLRQHRYEVRICSHNLCMLNYSPDNPKYE